MRILVLSNLYPPNVVGGYERLCFEVTEAMARRGHEMVVLTSRYGGKVAGYPGQKILRELDLLTGPDIYTPFPGSSDERDTVNRSNLATLDRVLADEQPDVVFAWNLFFLDESMLARLEASPFRTVLMLTDNWLLVMRNPGFVADFFRDYVHGPARFVPPPSLAPPTIWQRLMKRLHTDGSNKGRTKLEAIFGATFVRDLYAAGGSTFDRYRVVHNGVKQDARSKIASRDRARLVDPEILHLLFAGRLVDLKGAHTAVAALPYLDSAALGISRIQLTLLGDTQDAAYARQLDAAISQSGRAADIVLRPTVPENALFELFNDHDLYIFPSLYEPFSLTLIHAMASGIPTIASRVGGNEEIIQDGESGLLFEKGDPRDLARAISTLAGDPALRVRLAQGGQTSASRFSFERMVGEMTTILTGRS